ncbi:MAG: hypothetical protein GY847_01670 [Proteobacteria bacterium]|nr:hypothetical protein [Pseudomonadota bacterium]
MNITEAIKRAREETSLHPLGSRWIFSWFDQRTLSWREAGPYIFQAAKRAQDRHIKARALDILREDIREKAAKYAQIVNSRKKTQP